MNDIFAGLDAEEVNNENDLFSGLDAEEVHPEISPGTAIGESIIQGATGGLSDEARGFGSLLGEALARSTGPEPIRSPNPEVQQQLEQIQAQQPSLGDVYRETRDVSRQQYKEIGEQYPITSFAGELAGGLATLPLAAAKGMGGAAKLGALVGVGAGESDLTKGDIGGVALEASIGAGAGALGHKLGEKVSDYVSQTAIPKLKELGKKAGLKAEQKALQAVGPEKKLIQKELKEGLSKRAGAEGTSRGIGRTVLDEDILKYTGGSQGTIGRIDEVLEKKGSELNQIVNQVDDAIKSELNSVPPISALDVGAVKNIEIAGIDSLKDRTKQATEEVVKRMKRTPDGMKIADSVAESMNSYIDNVLEANKFDIKELMAIKNAVGKRMSELEWVKDADAIAPYKQITRDLYFGLKNYIEDLADKASPEAGTKIKEANKIYGNLIATRQAALGELVSDMRSRGFEFGDFLAMSVGGYLGGGFLGSITAFAGKKGVEATTGHDVQQLARIFTSKNLDKLSKNLDKLGTEEASKLSRTFLSISKNPDFSGRVAALSPILANQSYKNIMESALENFTPDEVKPEIKKGIPNAFKIRSEEELGDLRKRLQSQYGEQANPILKIIDSGDNSTIRRKNALLFSIMQKPEYRQMINDLYVEDKDQENE